jgi:hypothetical protein
MRTVAFLAGLASRSGQIEPSVPLVFQVSFSRCPFWFFGKNNDPQNPTGGSHQKHPQQNFQISDIGPHCFF